MYDVELATEENFNEVAYLLANTDVAIAVMNGKIASAWYHFVSDGYREARKQLKAPVSQKQLDQRFIARDVPLSNEAKHSNQQHLIKGLLNKGLSILEIGSRRVTSDSLWLREAAIEAGAEYVGFDIYDGANVDIVGDAHRLSQYFNKKFDVIYSSAVFEHLAMPWIAALEIQKCLKLNGHLYVETHFSFKSHERPWHFFQFSDMALKVLFSPLLGFECIDAGVSNPLVGRFSSLADSNLKYGLVSSLYCHSEYYGRKVREVVGFDWAMTALGDIVGDTAYPTC